MHAANNFVVLVCCVEEDNRSVAQTNSNGVFVWAVLNSKNYSHTLDVFLPLHGWGVVNADETHALLEQNHLIDLLKIEDLLYVVVVRCLVLDIRTLSVAHVCVALCARVRLLDFVFYEVGGELLELNRFARCLFRSVEEVNQRLNEVVAVTET